MADDWYALQIRPRWESLVAAHLRYRGYEPFLPTYQAKRRWADRIKILDSPLFPGYLFCQFNLNTRMPILTTPGVSGIVGVGKSPQPVDEAEIEAIRTVIQSGIACKPYPRLRAGQRVRVEDGALQGLTGVVMKYKDDYRLIISVTLLMRSVSVEIDRSSLKPIADPLPLGAASGLTGGAAFRAG